jgi:hypothetical protein
LPPWVRDSKSAAAIEKYEDHSWTRQGDQGQGSEVGDQVEVDAHVVPCAAR